MKSNEQIIINVTQYWIDTRKSDKMKKCQICGKEFSPGDQIRNTGSSGRRRAIHAHHERY